MTDSASRSEFMKRLGKLPLYTRIPSSVLKLLKMPMDAVCEHSDDYLYYVVPSKSHLKDHLDPFDVLYGNALDSFDWTKYIFGVRYDGSHLYALVIDKRRRIAVCDSLLSFHDKGNMRWDRFEVALEKALEYAKTESPNPKFKTDHVMVTPWDGLLFIDVMDDLALPLYQPILHFYVL